jgi:hypothetical protein
MFKPHRADKLAARSIPSSKGVEPEFRKHFCGVRIRIKVKRQQVHFGIPKKHLKQASQIGR